MKQKKTAALHLMFVTVRTSSMVVYAQRIKYYINIGLRLLLGFCFLFSISHLYGKNFINFSIHTQQYLIAL